MLPFVQDRRSQLAESGSRASARAARELFDCGSCLAATPAVVRRTWNCGHLPRLPGNAYGGPPLDTELEPDATCPGYLISLPQVVEASHAYAWWEKGQLRDFCDDETPTPILRAAVELLGQSIGEAIRAAQKKAEPHG